MTLKREGNRKPNECRPIVMEVGVVPNSNGSAMVKFGKTTAIAAVYGPRSVYPKWKQRSDRALLNCIYSMLPFSTGERCRPGPSRRSTEISQVITCALAPAIFLEDYPKSVIDVYINIIEANAGTRTTAINAASLALSDAGIAMKDLVAAVAGGVIDGTYVVDLEGKEEDASKCDIPLAYMPRNKQVTLLQMDGDLTPKEASEVIKLNIKTCEQICEKQKQALRKKWEK